MLRLSLLWPGCPQGGREEETVGEPPCSCFLSSARLIQIGAGRTGSGGPCQLPVPPSPPQQPRQGGTYHSLHVVIVIVLYLGQETAKAQSGLMLEIVQDKGNVEQAILDLQKRLEAVSVRP